MNRFRRVPICVGLVALLYGYVGLGALAARAAEYQWDFEGNLNSTFGTGILSYADASSQLLTTFRTTDGTTVPHIGGEQATYLHVPAFSQLSEGYNLELASTGPNGGGQYVNQYTMVFDLCIPGDLNWAPLYNTNPENANDADMYLTYDGAVGINALGYSGLDIIVPDTWYRLAIAVDLGAGRAAYYLNGVSVYELTGAPQLDGRFSLYSNVDEGHDLRLFNEGDESGQYTHDLYVNSFYFTDRELSASEVLTLGGPTAEGIIVALLEGDYNDDGTVDAADYVVWRNSFGQMGAGLAADGNRDLKVDEEDYLLWKDNYGESMGGGQLATAAAPVPEPSLMGFGWIVLAAWLGRARPKSSGV